MISRCLVNGLAAFTMLQTCQQNFLLHTNMSKALWLAGPRFTRSHGVGSLESTIINTNNMHDASQCKDGGVSKASRFRPLYRTFQRGYPLRDASSAPPGTSRALQLAN
eukprot:5041786-Amphidinium_carterae.2